MTVRQPPRRQPPPPLRLADPPAPSFPRPNFRVMEPLIVHSDSIITTVLWKEGDPPYDQDAPQPHFPLRLVIFEP